MGWPPASQPAGQPVNLALFWDPGGNLRGVNKGGFYSERGLHRFVLGRIRTRWGNDGQRPANKARANLASPMVVPLAGS